MTNSEGKHIFVTTRRGRGGVERKAFQVNLYQVTTASTAKSNTKHSGFLGQTFPAQSDIGYPAMRSYAATSMKVVLSAVEELCPSKV
eukprot:345635-Rhodomonas_salina.2